VTQSPARSKAPVVFAILGLLAALAAGGAYAYQQLWDRNGRSPEQTVDAFLTAVFNRDVAGTSEVVCDDWEPNQAIARTLGAIPIGANVSWEEIRLLSTTEERAVVQATLGLRPFFDEEISDRIHWTFNLVDEHGWRVCEARPLA
jgi:hypothetical protein